MRLSEIILRKPVFEEMDRVKLPDGVLSRVTYPICNLGQRNANNRVYEKAVFEKVLGDDSIQEKLENRNLFGQAEHPAETQSDLQLTSHVIHKMWIDEEKDIAYQTLDIVDTPPGRIVDALLRADCMVGVSTRAEGDIEEADDDEGTYHRIIPESYNYVTTDFTADPSTYNTLPIDVKRNVVSEIKKELENKELKEDERKFTQLILESMECKDGKCVIESAKKLAQEKASEKKEIKAQTIEDLVKNEFIKIGAIVEFKAGEHKDKKGKVEKIEEKSVTIGVGEDNGSFVSVNVYGNTYTSVSPDGVITVLPVPSMETDVMEQPPEEAEPEMPTEEEEEVIEPPVEEEEPEEEEVEEKCKDKKKVKEQEVDRVESQIDDVVDRAVGVGLGRTATIEMVRDRYTHPNKAPELIDAEFVQEHLDRIVRKLMGLSPARFESKVSKDGKKVKEQEVEVPDKDARSDTGIPSNVIPVEKGLGDKILPGNVLRDKEEKYWVVKDLNVNGLSVETAGGGVGAEVNIPWDDVEARGLVKVQEVKEQKLSGDFKIDETTRSEVIELLKQGKVVYGVVEGEPGEGYMVAKISNLEEYEKSGYWDIVESHPTEEEAIAAAKELSKGENGVYIEVHESKVDETKDIKAMYKSAGLPAPDGKGVHTKAFHKLAIDVAKGYVEGGDSPKKALKKAYPTAMKQLGKEKAVKKASRKSESKEVKESKWTDDPDEQLEYIRTWVKSARGEDIVRLYNNLVVVLTDDIVAQSRLDILDSSTSDNDLRADIYRHIWKGLYGPSESISTTAKEMTDLRIQEASTRAERDKAFEVVAELEALEEQLGKGNSNKLLEVKILIKKLKETMSRDGQVINALRRKVEEKAVLAKQVEKQLSEMKANLEKDMAELIAESKESNHLVIQGSEKAMSQLKSSYDKEVKDLNESIASTEKKHSKEIKQLKTESDKKLSEEVEKARKEVTENVTKEFVKQFVMFRLAETGLTVDENSRALLEECRSLDQVDDTLDELRDIGRRSALHSQTLKEVVITEPVDPDQADVDRKVGAVFEGFGYKKGINDD